MAVRKDKIQLEVEINGKKAGKTYNELNRDARNLQRELRNLVPGTDAFIKKSAELKKVNSRLADIRSKTKGVAQGLNQMRVEAAKAPGVFKRISNSLGSLKNVAFIGLAVAGFNKLVSIAKETLKLYDQQAKADAQLRAAIKSTGQAAGRTFEQLKQQATDLQGTTIFGDEATQGAQSILLTFTNVREEIFDRALPAVLDMSTALGTDLKSSSIQVGKALNDPIQGISALSRAGIQFTEDQKTLIKTLVETGETAKAQTIILKELETQFGGSAEAAAKAGTGPLTQLSNKFGDLQETIGQLVSGGLRAIAPLLSGIIDKVQSFTNAVVDFIAPTQKASEATRALQTEFNIEIETLKRGDLSYENRKQLIDDINRKYGEYLPNLLDEKSSLEDIEAAQIAANSAFQKRIILLAAEEQFVEVNKKLLEAKREELELQKELSRRQAGADSAREGSNQRANNSRSGIDSERSQAEQLLKRTELAVSQNQKLQEELRASFEETQKAAEELGLSIADIGRTDSSSSSSNKPSGTSSSDSFTKAFDQRIKAAKAAFDKESLFLEQARIKNDVTEQEFGEQTLELKRAFYQNQLEVFKAFGQEQEAEAIKLQNNLLEIEKIKPSDGSNPRKVDEVAPLPTLELTQVEQGTDSKIDDLTAQSERELEILEEKFLRALLSEQEYNLAVLETKAAGFEEQLLFLEEAGLAETEQYRGVQLEKLRVGKEIDTQRIQNAKRTQELEAKVQMQGFEAAKQVFELGAGLLDADAKARGKHATIIKAFEAAKIAIDLQSEVASIWRNAQQAIAAKVIGPTAGTAIAVVQTAFAVARSHIRLRKIASAKFADGGKVKHSMPTYSGQHIGDDANIPEQSNGDNILAFVRKGEVILNERQQAALGGSPIFKRIGVPGFADGGLVTVNTTPVIQDLNLNNPSQTADNSELITEMRLTRAAIERIPTNLRAFVVYNDIEDAATEINNVRDEANF